MVRYEYMMERIALRSAGRPIEKLDALGKKGFKAVQAVPQSNDLVILFMKAIETKSVSAEKKADPAKKVTKKDQQKIEDVAPTTKQLKEVVDELKAEE